MSSNQGKDARAQSALSDQVEVAIANQRLSDMEDLLAQGADPAHALEHCVRLGQTLPMVVILCEYLVPIGAWGQDLLDLAATGPVQFLEEYKALGGNPAVLPHWLISSSQPESRLLTIQTLCGYGVPLGDKAQLVPPLLAAAPRPGRIPHLLKIGLAHDAGDHLMLHQAMDAEQPQSVEPLLQAYFDHRQNDEQWLPAFAQQGECSEAFAQARLHFQLQVKLAQTEQFNLAMPAPTPSTSL